MAKNRKKAIQAVKDRIVPVSDASPYVRALLFGRTGQGKTRIAATGAKGPKHKCLIVDINEEGTTSVSEYPYTDVFHVRKWEEIFWVYWFLREGDHYYKSVVLDTMTNLQIMCMKHVLREADDRDPNRDPKTASQREWGKMAEYLMPVILDFRNLPMHVIFTAQQRNDDVELDDGTVTREIVPDLSPKPRGFLLAAVEICGYVYQREVRSTVGKGKNKREVKKHETRMLVAPHEKYPTKDRTYELGRVVRDPTLDLMIEAKKRKAKKAHGEEE